MFFIVYAFKGHVHAFAGRVKVMSLVLQDMCNMQIFLSPDLVEYHGETLTKYCTYTV